MNPASTTAAVRRIAIIGNPNAGKTTIFNGLTGMRQKVANYPGVTVEKKEGTILLPSGGEATLIDLPGTYSLQANSPDEKVATEVLFGKMDGGMRPDLVICVVDAANLERNLYLVSQILDFRLPVIVALNMIDAAEQAGTKIDVKKLSAELGVPVIATVATKEIGVGELKAAIESRVDISPKSRQWKIPNVLRDRSAALAEMLKLKFALSEPESFRDAIILLTSPHRFEEYVEKYDSDVTDFLKASHLQFAALEIDPQSVFVEARYEWIQTLCKVAVVSRDRREVSVSDKLDAVLTHKVWGFVIFLGLMVAIFQSIFTWSQVPMDLIGAGFDKLGVLVTRVMPAGDLRDLIVTGALGGVSAVVTFLPQILFLFLFIGLLEDTGYMARAAFIMDRLMGKVGLHGKSFIPLLSSFACAIPGIMATRTIENRKDRIVTILIAPLMSCSARLPVYTLMIAAFIPHKYLLGFFSIQGLVLVSMYLLGFVMALLMGWLFKKTLLKGEAPAFIMELPPYKLPSLRSVLMQMWERGLMFLKKAGTLILGFSIVLWFLATYPRNATDTPAQRLEHSFVGQAGHFVEPLIRPLGFDWKIGVGIVSSVVQREVFVSTMGTLYNIKDSEGGTGTVSLTQRLQDDIDPATGLHTFGILTALSVMVYYVLALQCLSTFAVVKRETNGWKWPVFQLAYMSALAYVVTFIVYRGGLIFMRM